VLQRVCDRRTWAADALVKPPKLSAYAMGMTAAPYARSTEEVPSTCPARPVEAGVTQPGYVSCPWLLEANAPSDQVTTCKYNVPHMHTSYSRKETSALQMLGGVVRWDARLLTCRHTLSKLKVEAA